MHNPSSTLIPPPHEPALSDLTALLTAILENPADDTARLVLADLLTRIG
jgi:hypothetical protein